MIKVKVCGLTDPSNVRAISECGVDFAGYIFYPHSRRYVGRNPDKSLFKNAGREIMRVGVFVNEEIPKVLESANYADLNLIQLHGNESVKYCMELKAYGVSLIKAFGVGSDFNFRITDNYAGVCDYFLFDTKTSSHGGSGEKFDWSLISNYSLKKPFFLSGGIGPEDTNIILTGKSQLLYAVDINSRFETQAGIKDSIKVKNFINEIRKGNI